MNALIKFYTVSGATLVGGYIIYKKFFYSSNITREQYFQDAIDLLKGYEPAVKNLGNPIKHNKKTFDEKDAFNQITNTNVKLKIPIEGAKKEADLFVFASRPENDPNWNIDSLELKYRGTPSRYKFYDRSLLFKNTLPKPNNN